MKYIFFIHTKYKIQLKQNINEPTVINITLPIISHLFHLPGERPYKCHLPDCGRAFIQLSNLQQHLRNHDAQVERAKNRPFHCNICGKGFATESSLRTHTAKVSILKLLTQVLYRFSKSLITFHHRYVTVIGHSLHTWAVSLLTAAGGVRVLSCG